MLANFQGEDANIRHLFPSAKKNNNNKTPEARRLASFKHLLLLKTALSLCALWLKMFKDNNSPISNAECLNLFLSQGRGSSLDTMPGHFPEPSKGLGAFLISD